MTSPQGNTPDRHMVPYDQSEHSNSLCGGRQQVRRELPASFDQATMHIDNHLPSILLAGEFYPSPDTHQQELDRTSMLSPTNYSNATAFDLTSQQENPPDSAALPVLQPANQIPWTNVLHDGSDGYPPQKEIPTGLQPSTVHIAVSPVADESSHVRTSGSQPSFSQLVHDQETMVMMSQGVMSSLHEESSDKGPGSSSTRDAAPKTPVDLPTQSQSVHENIFDTNGFLLETNFDAYGFLSPGVMDFLDFTTPRPPALQTPRPSVRHTPSVDCGGDATPEILFSVNQVRRMRQLWLGRRPTSVAQTVHSLWHNVIQHGADNIFSAPGSASKDVAEPASKGQRISKWGFNAKCRERMIDFYKKLDESAIPRNDLDLTSSSTSEAPDPDLGIANASLPSSSEDFPTTEVLDASLDLFFERSFLPFIHKATFDARTVPESLLLAMCLVGISSLYPERSGTFVSKCQKKLLHFYCVDLVSKSEGHFPFWELLISLTTGLLVVYLSLGQLEATNESQAYNLRIQLLHVAEKHGFFAASACDDLATELRAAPADSEGSWKCWSRVEAVKRVITSLLSIDMAYARLLGRAGVIDIQRVEVYLECDSRLFDAPTPNRFLQAGKSEAQLIMPQLQLQLFHAESPPLRLSARSIETILSAAYLQLAAVRYKLPVTHRGTVDAPLLDMKDGKVKDIVRILLSLPSKYASSFQRRHEVTAFAWNNVCISLTADLDLLEIASGREGLLAARTAMKAVSEWSQTSRARRAILHAAQIYDILASSRLGEWNIARPDLLLFQSALVLSMYLFASKSGGNDHDSTSFELLQDIDWTAIGHEGIWDPSETMEPSLGLHSGSLSDSAHAAREFVQHGGPVSFSGELLGGGGATARKILLNHVHLLDDIGKYPGSYHSRLLRTMGDFVIEGNR
ncbi:hypothetical protein LTR10_021691 [Elasticomyces elasticus]|uniref:Xylanolytic transcriptional activator regulatory domain-containing protein n=1 Tax=Exophiala sideris TaxID=1016849 RepID=A0ABR0IWA3_9EURO|nr:hypothetical protein LTR10_021691 [Elasticomyces elasticus]KAK5021136.1 hypothetical protein LTS07_011223 [Exophiala sideris]KAK5023747.1 hypothetical protein LTR13_011125 [Exophiala sideris]KAK5048826.1 hypothetical protein LTR69_011240 [Exophiala sideris]KAK5176313.1 hypothetical protein LTR44_011144 [Eurotiomycetes sp. CCFEE 6388]